MPASSAPDPRAILQDAAEQRRYSLRQLSQAIGKNPTYLQQYVAKGSPKTLDIDLCVKLGRLLDIAPERLRHGAPPQDHSPAESSEGAPSPLSVLSREDLQTLFTRHLKEVMQGQGVPPQGLHALDDIPITGRLETTRFVATGPSDEVERLPRPESLKGAPRAYALRILDGRFEPLLFAGDLCFVNPNEPAIPGDLVALQREDGELVIGRFCERTGPTARLRSTDNQCAVVVTEVRQAHKVVSVKLR